MSEPNTNLAAEFYVLSALHRVGIEAYLTLGNKKACDIVAIREDRTSVSVEVKAVAGSNDWRAGNLDTLSPDSHYVALVCFEGEIKDTTKPPGVWVIPFRECEPLLRAYSGTKNVSRADVLKTGSKYQNAWGYISGEIR
jgi:hypothetical protein